MNIRRLSSCVSLSWTLAVAFSVWMPEVEAQEKRWKVELVRDIAPGSDGSSPRNLQTAGGIVYFTANDGVTGRELWRTNGTPGGTVPVADILPGPLTAFPGPNSFGSLNGLLVFRAYENNGGAELWRSEGLAANTARIFDLNPGASGSNPFGLVEIDGALMFDAEIPATGAELYRTDGTAAGTSLVMDIWPGASGSSPASFQRAGNAVFFSAERPAEGRELWRTLGTFLTTTLVRDIRPGGQFLQHYVDDARGRSGVFFRHRWSDGHRSLGERWDLRGNHRHAGHQSRGGGILPLQFCRHREPAVLLRGHPRHRSGALVQ